jgi:hypothetical protein
MNTEYVSYWYSAIRVHGLDGKYSIYYADANYVANRATSTPRSIDSTSSTT